MSRMQCKGGEARKASVTLGSFLYGPSFSLVFAEKLDFFRCSNLFGFNNAENTAS
jgi:hypothetical protein